MLLRISMGVLLTSVLAGRHRLQVMLDRSGTALGQRRNLTRSAHKNKCRREQTSIWQETTSQADMHRRTQEGVGHSRVQEIRERGMILLASSEGTIPLSYQETTLADGTTPERTVRIVFLDYQTM